MERNVDVRGRGIDRRCWKLYVWKVMLEEQEETGGSKEGGRRGRRGRRSKR